MEITDSIEKLTKPGLWFVKSMQPAMDISRMVYEVAVKGCLALDIFTSEKQIIQNEVIALIVKDLIDSTSDENERGWLEQEVTEHRTHGFFWYPEEMNDYVEQDYFWKNQVVVHEISFFAPRNCCFLTAIIDSITELYYEEETDLAKSLLLHEQDFLEYGCAAIVFVSNHYSGSVADFIESHLL